MKASLIRNDIPAEGSEMWKMQWNACTDAVMEWLDELQDEHSLIGVWSLWNVRDFTAIPFPNATTVTYDTHWGNETVVVNLPENATWFDLWRAAGKCIKKSGDGHHIFIEQFRPNGNTLNLITGS